MTNARTEIVVKQGDKVLGRYELAPGKYVIGRDPACDICIQVTGVADRHVRLTYDGELIEVEDLGSPTGTTLAGKRLQQPVQLDENGVLHLGEVTVEIRQLPGDMTQVKRSDQRRFAGSDDVTMPPSPRPAEPPPVRLTKSRERVYEVAEVVARGGMGAVMRAKDLNIKRTVAMKVVLDQRGADADLVQRFRQEAELTGQLEHPNIVPIYDLAFDEKGQPFYTMKFVKGVTLQAVLDQIKAGDTATLERYSLAQLLTIFQKVCDAVAYAHSKGVVHRDLKPPNIMLGDYGEVLVMDWGLAKALGRDETARGDANPVVHSMIGMPAAELTLAGTVMGSPQFMAPEQAAGKLNEIDARTDIFALGGILYNLLTLHTPVSGDSIAEMLRKIREGEILPPTSYNSKTGRKKAGTITVGTKTFPQPPLVLLRHCPGGKIPESLAAVAMKALALRREDRYPSVPALQKDIEAYQGGFATVAENAGAAKQLWLLIKRHKREFIIAHAALLMLIVVGVGFLVKVTKEKNRAEAERQRAETEKASAQTERDRAEKTLVELHKTAPTFYAQAQTLIEQRQWPEAMEKASFAVSLAPEMADYQVLYGNLLQTELRMAEARDAYAAALHQKPDNKVAKENLALCQAFLRDEDGKHPYRATSLNPIQAAMLRQGRTAEAGAFTRFMQTAATNRVEVLNAWSNVVVKAGFDSGSLHYTDDGLTFGPGTSRDYTNDTLAPLQGIPLNKLGLGENAPKVRDLRPLQGMPLHYLVLRTGLIADLSPLQGMHLRRLELTRCRNVTDLIPLQGMPLEWLDLGGCRMADLSVLHGMMPLTWLSVNASGVSDISPLAGMRLTSLDISSTGVSDLSPLRGMPLKDLNASATPVSDLSPLTGLPLQHLMIGNTPVKDLRPLHGMPLTSLTLNGMNIDDLTPLKGLPLKSLSLYFSTVTDLNPLRGLPLKGLMLGGCTNLQDLTPLTDCLQLEVLIIPATCKNIKCLRSHPTLKQLGSANGSLLTVPTVAEFWKAYDAKKTNAPAGKPTP